MLKNKRLASGLLAVPLVTILLIAGCTVDSPKPSESPTSAPSISAPANPTASPAPTASEAPPAPAAEVGAVVDQATAAELGKDTKGQLRGYPMPDGSYLVVDKSQPLPEPVQQDISRKGNDYASTYVADTGGQPNMLSDRTKLMGSVEADTGKTAILVVKLDVYTSPDSSERTTTYFVNGRGPRPDGVNRNRDEITAFVNDWIAKQPNPNDYVVIWPN